MEFYGQHFIIFAQLSLLMVTDQDENHTINRDYEHDKEFFEVINCGFLKSKTEKLFADEKN